MEDYDIFVYCGGKCGDRTLQRSFENSGYKTCHLHNNHYWINNLKNTTPIFDIIDNVSRDKKIYIIDCYRTPIERSISSFFQNIHTWLPSYRTFTIHEIISFFNKKKLFLLEKYHPINEVLEYYGLPLFDKFDFNKRYNIIEKENKVFIKVLFSDINNWENILSEIIGKKITVIPDDLPSSKQTYNLYNNFKKLYNVPKDFIENIKLNDKEFTIYNSEKEQDEYIKKWNRLNKTLIGKNGYLFLNNDANQELRVHNDNLCLIGDLTLKKYNNYKEKMILTIFPNKSLVYKHYLPDGYDIKYRPAFDIYNEYFKERIIDGYKILENEEDTFYKTDTHMNLKGSYTIYCNFIKKLNEVFKLNVETKDITINKKTVKSLFEINDGIGDLMWNINLGYQELSDTEDNYYFSNELIEIYLKYTLAENDPLRLLTINNNKIVDVTDQHINSVVDWNIITKNILYKKNSNKPKRKCLIFYDSFLLSTLDLYLEMFEEVYLSKTVFYKPFIEAIQPDYIFEFRIERFLT